MGRYGRHTGRFGNQSKKKALPDRVDSVLGSSLASLGLAAKIKEHNLKKAWAGCVGDGIARRSAPERLIGTVLYCTVATSAWMTELLYQKTSIISKLNGTLGGEAVTDIVFRIGSVAPYAAKTPPAPVAPARELSPDEKRFIETNTSGITDDGLKDAIKRAFSRSRS